MKEKKTEIINIRVLQDVKENSKRVLYKYGIDHSKGLRYFLNYIIEHDQLPKEIEDFIKEEIRKEQEMKKFK